MSNCLKRSSQKHSRFLKFIDRFPVRCRRAGFHKKERSFLDTAHQIMLHSCINCCDILFFFVPSWIVIPGDNIENIFKFLIIQAVKIIHQICGYRQFGTALTDCVYFIFDKVDRLICHKTFPVKFQSMKFIFTLRRRAFNLIKTVINMTPECGAPMFIKIFDCSIFLFQPLSELRLTQRTMAFSAELVGYVPQHNCRMFAESFCQLFINCMNFLSVYRRGEAVVRSATEESSCSVRIHTQDFFVFVCHPFGSCA